MATLRQKKLERKWGIKAILSLSGPKEVIGIKNNGLIVSTLKSLELNTVFIGFYS